MGPPACTSFVAYYRASSKPEDRSGLGLNAQHEAAASHAALTGGMIVGAFEEQDSGKYKDWPQLNLAIAECRLRRAVLLIARLGKLRRSTQFLRKLQEAGVEFLSADMPHVTHQTVGMMVVAADERGRAISGNTKAALAGVKARGTKLGNPRLLHGDSTTAADARASWSAAAERRAAAVLPCLIAVREAGAVTLQQMADALNAQGLRTPRGGKTWRPSQVRRVLARVSPMATSHRDECDAALTLTVAHHADPKRPTDPNQLQTFMDFKPNGFGDSQLNWIEPGATFFEDGVSNRITAVAEDRLEGVSDTEWVRSLSHFVAAVRCGRIKKSAGAKRWETTKSGRDRVHLSETIIQHLAGVSEHPLMQHYRRDLGLDIWRTLQALRDDAPVEPALLVTLFHILHAGATSIGLGYYVVSPTRKGGRRSARLAEAQATQDLLKRLEAFIKGSGDFLLADLRHVELIAEAGLQAVGAAPPVAKALPGRPPSRLSAVQQVHALLAYRWRDHERGLYQLSDALREVTEQKILQQKRIGAGWAGKSPDSVCLDASDEDLLRSSFRSLEVAYHKHPAMSADARFAYRRRAAEFRRFFRSNIKRTVS